MADIPILRIETTTKQEPSIGFETRLFLNGKELHVSEVELISLKGEAGDYWKAKITYPVVLLDANLTALAEIEGRSAGKELDGPLQAR